MIRWLLLALSILRIVPLMSPVPAHFGAIYLGESLSTDLNFSPAYFSLSRCVSRACPPFLSLSISPVLPASFTLPSLSLFLPSFSFSGSFTLLSLSTSSSLPFYLSLHLAPPSSFTLPSLSLYLLFCAHSPSWDISPKKPRVFPAKLKCTRQGSANAT